MVCCGLEARAGGEVGTASMAHCGAGCGSEVEVVYPAIGDQTASLVCEAQVEESWAESFGQGHMSFANECAFRDFKRFRQATELSASNMCRALSLPDQGFLSRAPWLPG